MTNKFFYLYLIGGSIALILLVYQLITFIPGQSNYLAIGADVLLMVLLFYMAFKVYREKTDKDLM